MHRLSTQTKTRKSNKYTEIQVVHKKLTKLEIWGKAQRESARRPKSDWRKLGGKGKERGEG